MSENSNLQVRVDFERILDTIASRIYDNQFAFLRENVQNAIDAIRIQAIRDGSSVESGYRIDIEVDGATCGIRDTGNGMTKEELQINFWTMGASGKNSSEARRAGCIGTFGIGGFANFGICERLTVISRSQACTTAHKTSLARSDFNERPGQLPAVKYEESDAIDSHGTLVVGVAKESFDVNGLQDYIKQFVSRVREPVYFNGERISHGKPFSIGENYKEVSDMQHSRDGDMSVEFQIYKDEGDSLAARIVSAKIGDTEYECVGFVRLVSGPLRVFKRGFKLCDISVTSRIGISGSFDSDIARPTAGRDSLSADSLSNITKVFHIIESVARAEVVKDENLLAAHVRLLPDILAQGDLSELGLLRVSTLDGDSYLLSQLEEAAKSKRVFYSMSHQKTPAAEVIQAKGDLIVAVSNERQRRRAETQYLEQKCGAKMFDNLIERLEPYLDLDAFERALLAEMEMAVKKLFTPESFVFMPGRLTLDVPIYWSNRKRDEKTIVYIDTRHGEFEKLRPLGYTPLLWSMVEAFCREYLGDTLRRRSTKFFGSGAINLEAFSKSHSELWELVPGEIETSMLDAPHREQQHRGGYSFGRVHVVRTEDITEVAILSEGSPASAESENDQLPGKLLHIVDKSGSTGLNGYYIRIPVSASMAFGEIIRAFPKFAVLWFANRVTWSGSDGVDTAFLYHVTLDRIIGEPAGAHGAIELDSTRLQNYRDQIYFYIPPEFEQYLVPNVDQGAIKVSVTHELVDLGRSRSWTSPRDLIEGE